MTEPALSGLSVQFTRLLRRLQASFVVLRRVEGLCPFRRRYLMDHAAVAVAKTYLLQPLVLEHSTEIFL
jgi:hypothetical protein